MADSKLATNVGSSVGAALGTAIGGPVGGVAGNVLGSMAGGLISAAPSLMKTDYDRYNEEQLRKLRRQQELNALGLTEEQKQAQYEAAAGGALKAGADVKAIQSGLAASLASGAGQAAAKQVAGEEAMMAARADAERKVAELNAAERQNKLQEIETRTAQEAQRKLDKQQALAGVAMTGIGALDEEITRIKGIRGAGPSKEQVADFQKLTGLNPSQIGSVIEKAAKDEVFASLLGQILGKGGTTGLANAPTGTTESTKAPTPAFGNSDIARVQSEKGMTREQAITYLQAGGK